MTLMDGMDLLAHSVGGALQDGIPGFLEPLMTRLPFFGGTIFLAALSLYVYAAVRRELGLHLAVLMVLTSLLGTVLQWTVRIPAPPEEIRLAAVSLYSFPDIHTARITAFAIFLGHFQPSNRVRYASLSAVILVSLGRLYSGTAHPGDIVGGIVLGVASVWMISRTIRFLGARDDESGRGELLAFIAALFVSVFGLLKIFIPSGNGGADFLGIPGGLILAHHIGCRYVGMGPGDKKMERTARTGAITAALAVLVPGALLVHWLLIRDGWHPVPRDALALTAGLAVGAVSVVPILWQWKGAASERSPG